MQLTKTNWLKTLRDDQLARQTLYPDLEYTGPLTKTNFLIELRENILERQTLYPTSEYIGFLHKTNWLRKLRNWIITNQLLYPEGGRSGLGNAINKAISLIDDTVISVNGTDVPTNIYWVTQNDHNTLSSAVTSAQGIFNDDNSTDEQIENAIIVLNSAIAVFNSIRQLGIAVNKSELNSAINNAKTTLSGTPISIDGSEILKTEFWITQETYNTLNSAIGIAQIVFDNPIATQQEVDNAISVLNSAIQTFNSARQPGIMEPPVQEGWTLTYSQPSMVTMNRLIIPLSNFTGYKIGMVEELDTPNTGVYNSDWTPTGHLKLFAQYLMIPPDIEVEVPLDDQFSHRPTNRLVVFEWESPNIRISGDNSTGEPISLRLVFDPK